MISISFLPTLLWGFSAFSFIFLDLSFLHLYCPNQTGETDSRQNRVEGISRVAQDYSDGIL